MASTWQALAPVRPRLESWLGVMLLVMACGPDDVGVEGSGSDTTIGSSSGGLETTSPATWPDDSYGAFYLETTLPLGTPGMYVTALSNLELGPDGLVVTHLSCDGERWEEQLSVAYEGTQAHVRPRDGESMVMWRGGPLAAELILRPGSSCRTLDAELVDPAPGYPSEWQWQWLRGALIITDPCGSTDDVWAFDLQPHVPTDCASSG